MIKGIFFIPLAVFLDLIQAGISIALLSIASFPGTAGGGAAGCAAGGYFLGEIGCLLGGGVLAILGSVLNPILATFTVPLGMVLGITINFCISVTVGTGLIMLMAAFDALSPKRLLWSGGEIVPGLNNIPFWTLFVIWSLWDKAQESENENAPTGILALASAAFVPTRGIMNMREAAMAIPKVPRTIARFNTLARTNIEQERIPQPESVQELVDTAQQRPKLQDIRSVKTQHG